MTKPKPRDQAWAARKVAAATTKPSEDEAARLRSRDALLAAFRVSAAGVDVTQWLPALPPEIERAKKRAAEPKPGRREPGR